MLDDAIQIGELVAGKYRVQRIPYIAMEYLEGQDLDQLLEASGPLSVAVTVEMAMQVCVAF